MTVTTHNAARSTAAAQAAITDRHAELRQVMDEWAGRLISAVAHGAPTTRTVSLLRTILADEVLPHARAEERTLYPAAARHPRTELLVRALVTEHHAIEWRASRLAGERGAAAAATAEAISSLFAVHVAKEDYLLLPALARSGSSLAALVRREHDLAGRR